MYGIDVDQQGVGDKVFNIADNRAQMSAPVLMDIGHVGYKAYACYWIGEGEGEGRAAEV